MIQLQLLLLAVVFFISGCSSNTSSETTENRNSNVSESQGKQITMGQAVDLAETHLQTQELFPPDNMVDVLNLKNMNSKPETIEKKNSNVRGNQGKRITMGQAVDIAVKHLQSQKLLPPDYIVDVSNLKKPGKPWMVTVTTIPGEPGGHVSVYINEDGSVGDTVPGA